MVSKIVKRTKHTMFKVGFTGTVANTEANKMTIVGMFGPVFNGITTEDLIERGLATSVKVTAIEIKHQPFYGEYQKELEYIRGCEERNTYITKLASSFKTNTLVLFNHIDHGEFMKSWATHNTEKEIFFITGSSSLEERAYVKTYCETNSDALIFATFGVFQQGISIPSLQNLVIAAPTKSGIRLLQSVGRVIRLHSDKEFARVIDVFDNMKEDGGKPNHVLRHFIDRYKIYETAGYDVDIKQGLTITH
jgi:superfamily II DNA or RNA helicase